MRSILVAGVGNVFFGDDGFGVEVAHRLGGATWPPGVRVADFGIRGLHLAYELLEPPDLLVLVDAVRRGDPPGTVSLLVPELSTLPTGQTDAHGMDLPAVFASVQAMGGCLPPLRLVGCEPAEVTERMGLSPLVEAAVSEAVELVREVVARELAVAELRQVRLEVE